MLLLLLLSLLMINRYSFVISSVRVVFFGRVREIYVLRRGRNKKNGMLGANAPWKSKWGKVYVKSTTAKKKKKRTR